MTCTRRYHRRTWTALTGVLALATAACSAGESSDAPGDESEPGAEQPVEDVESVPIVAEGATMVFRVDETVSTDSHEAGATFTARLSEAVLATDGSVALPAGAASTWVVTQSEAGGEESLLAFRLQSVQLDGTSVPIEATVTGTEIQSEAGDSGTESAAKVAVGTAAGAIIGQILGGDTRSTLQGAGVGAAVGTVVALTTRGGEARLAPGSTVTVRLDESIEVR